MKKSTAIVLRIVAAVCISVVLLAVLRRLNFPGIWRDQSEKVFVVPNSDTSTESIPFHPGHSSGTVIKSRSSSTFTLAENFTFPHPWCALKDVNKIAKTGWVKQLAVIMETWPDNRTVFMVTANTRYLSSLLNWLISAVLKAHTPLNQILVISMDQNIHQLLQKRTISSVHVQPRSLFHNSSRFGSVMFTRLAIIRLLNHWGFTVAHFDSDALLLRDARPLFERYKSSSIVGQSGRFTIGRQRIRVCMGAVMTRGNQHTGNYL